MRIVELDITAPEAPVVTGEFIYRIDLQSSSNTTIQGRQRISDIAWQAPRRLLVDEHDDDALAATGTSTGRRLHDVDLNAATNLASAPAYDTFTERATRVAGVGGKTVVQPLGCYLDNGTAAELAALPTPVVPAAKSTYLDIGSAPAGVNFELGKPEGITFLDGLPGVAIANDNDFGFAQGAGLAITPAADPTEQLRFYTTRPQGTPPTILGKPRVPQTLSCHPGRYEGRGRLDTEFTWLRDGVEIPGVNTRVLRLTGTDVGAMITCRVDATRNTGPVRAPADPETSTPVGPVT